MAGGIQVIGAGLGRTGTMSLKAALERLGFGPCYHMTEVFAHPGHADFWQAAWRDEPVDWEGVLGGYGATLDWPACAFYKDLMKRHPDAKVILTVRDPERWYESVRTTIYALSKTVTRSLFFRTLFAIRGLLTSGGIGRGNMADEIIWDGTFDGRFEDRAYAIEVYMRHNAEVRRRVPPEQLLIYEVREGWEPLCRFLGVEKPEEPFPHLNDAAAMRSRLRAVRALSLIPYALPLVLALVLLRRRTRPQTGGQ